MTISWAKKGGKDGKRVEKPALATGVLALLLLLMGSAEPAIARGFCNIDNLGSKGLQEEVANAGAKFFDGGSDLMGMLAAFERTENNKGKQLGSSAVQAFREASNIYKSIAGKMSEISDDKLAGVKVEIAAAIAQTLPSVPLFSNIAETVKRQNASTSLISICRDGSYEMGNSTESFLEVGQNQEKRYSTLLSTWARVLFTGRTISAFFAAAGGQQ